MTTNLPAYRYELFQNLFEAYVTKQQEEIRKLEAQQKLYEVITKSLKETSPGFDHKVLVYPTYISINMTPSPNETLGGIEELHIFPLGTALYEANFHRSGNPSTYLGRYGISYSWYNHDENATANQVILSVDMPEQLFRDLELTTTEVPTTSVNYKVGRLETPKNRNWWKRAKA